MGEESFQARKEIFNKYLQEAQSIRNALRSDPEHQRLREEIDALNEITMHGEQHTSSNVVDAEYDSNTGHYVQANHQGTGEYVKGMIGGVANNIETSRTALDAQGRALRGIKKMSKKPLSSIWDDNNKGR